MEPDHSVNVKGQLTLDASSVVLRREKERGGNGEYSMWDLFILYFLSFGLRRERKTI